MVIGKALDIQASTGAAIYVGSGGDRGTFGAILLVNNILVIQVQVRTTRVL
jgi:hypothetical protein